MTDQAMALLQKHRDDLAEFKAPFACQWSKIDTVFSNLRLIIKRDSTADSDHLDNLITVRWVQEPSVMDISFGDGRTHSNMDRVESAIQQNEYIAKTAVAKVIGFLDTFIALGGTKTMNSPRNKVSLTSKIFVVHGHDEAMKQSVARTLEKLGLKPIILHEQPDTGKTIIEKVEKHADVGFAVVLLSPDDMGYKKDDGAEKAKPRARQNVILELGYFVGRLGRDKVMALKRGDDLEVPSDLSGVVYTPFDDHDGWKSKLVKELKAAGYKVSADDL